MTTIAVLGHCQAEGLADCVRAMAPGATVDTVGVFGPAPPGSPEERALLDRLDRADLVFTQISDDKAPAYGVPRAEPLARADRRVFTWPLIAFKGFHPDCTYVIQNGEAVTGRMGPYHSAIAAAAYLEGLDERRTLKLFNALTYGALGYFDEFEAAASVLSDAAYRSGLDVSSFLDAPRTAFVHTFNHPKIDILHALAAQLLRRAGIEPSAGDPPQDRLANGPAWPVYPELAKRLGTQGDLAFHVEGEDTPAALEAIVADTFQVLAARERDHGPIVLDQDRPMATPVIERARAFVRDHVIR